jgi:nucleotide-binding universal stress UspA family protein
MSIHDMKLILVPTDFGPTSDRALDVAIEVGRLTKASLEVLHVNSEAIWVVPPPGDVVTAPVDLGEVVAEATIQLEAVVARVRAAGLACTGVSQTGRTDAEIVEYARKRAADMIVVGSHGRHGLSHALMGSVAEKVVRHAPCPVLVVPPADESEVRPRPDDETPAMIRTEEAIGQPA